MHGSTITGLEHHTPGNIDEVIEQDVAHDTVFRQFMLYTPVPGTPLYREVLAEGRLLEDVNLADIHGQFKFNVRHDAISRDQSRVFLDRAFLRDFEVNGPSLYRLTANMFMGFRRYRDDPDPRVRARVLGEAKQPASGHGAALWAMEKYLRESNRAVSDRIAELRAQIERDIGGWSPLIDRLLGPALLWSARREARRGPAGRIREPRTFVERQIGARSKPELTPHAQQHPSAVAGRSGRLRLAQHDQQHSRAGYGHDRVRHTGRQPDDGARCRYVGVVSNGDAQRTIEMAATLAASWMARRNSRADIARFQMPCATIRATRRDCNGSTSIGAWTTTSRGRRKGAV